ncbi:DUF4350 domain-containing protein [Polymorphospora rubra]|uniref:DUF4350 domain-containing protein n=1 Tax=Polymorphospora rubra TaxID=338584 RepID=A0A810MUR1_9ACTN|nr:DUF4350 domain-containing protein [Polymorphospora rubra]BCJ64314.1 hypothetical protein Prubr_13350 [Polymorphospora rubra]
MTAVAPGPRTATAGPYAAPAETTPRRRRRRIAIPFGLVLLLFVITGVTYAVEEPDPADNDFLSPVSTAPVGARQLADRLRGHGASVERQTRTPAALASAYRGNATLFVPAPSMVHPAYLEMLQLLPERTRIVLVDPAPGALRAAGIPLRTGSRRWTTRAGPPGAGCGLAEAVEAGTAAALRQRYDRPPSSGPAGGQLDRCYDGGLVRLPWRSIDVVVIGTADPFRNDRLAEHRNAALATALLAAAPRVVWLDLHQPEPRPTIPAQSPDGDPPPAPDPDPDRDGEPPGGGPTSGDGGRPRPGGDSPAGGDGPPRADGPNPLWGAFPPWFWTLLAQLALALLILALWRARRLGPPAAEPLPVSVRSAETVLGRARLYHRAKARGPAAEILRSATLDRIVPLLDLPADPAPADVVTAVAAQTGQPPDEVDALLYGPAPATDTELLDLARRLDTLPHAVATPAAGGASWPSGSTGAPSPRTAEADPPPGHHGPVYRTDEGETR